MTCQGVQGHQFPAPPGTIPVGMNSEPSRYRVNGALIKSLRDARGWTQGQLAYKAGVGQGTISKIELGRRGGNVPVDTLMRLSTAFGVHPLDLVIEDASVEHTPPDDVATALAEPDTEVSEAFHRLARGLGRSYARAGQSAIEDLTGIAAEQQGPTTLLDTAIRLLQEYRSQIEDQDPDSVSQSQ